MILLTGAHGATSGACSAARSARSVGIPPMSAPAGIWDCVQTAARPPASAAHSRSTRAGTRPHLVSWIGGGEAVGWARANQNALGPESLKGRGGHWTGGQWKEKGGGGEGRGGRGPGLWRRSGAVWGPRGKPSAPKERGVEPEAVLSPGMQKKGARSMGSMASVKNELAAPPPGFWVWGGFFRRTPQKKKMLAGRGRCRAESGRYPPRGHN